MTTVRDLLQEDLKSAWDSEVAALQGGDQVTAAYYRGVREGIQKVLRILGAM